MSAPENNTADEPPRSQTQLSSPWQQSSPGTSGGLEIKVTSPASISTMNDGPSALDYSPSSTILQGLGTDRTGRSSAAGRQHQQQQQQPPPPQLRDSTARLKSLLSYLDEADGGVAVTGDGDLPSRQRVTEDRRSFVMDDSDSTDSDSERIDNVSALPQPPVKSIVRESVARGKKYVWDEWDSDGGDCDVSALDNPPSVASTSRLGVNTPQSTIGTMDTAKFEKLSAKIKLMRRELETKRQDSTALKASLARRKVSDQRVCSQIEASWNDRIRKRKVEHETALERQTQFLEQIERSIEMLEERKQGAEELLSYREANFVSEVEIVKREVSEKKKAAREEWLAAEKLRLQKLADAKSQELKKDAVKALEPELHRLISGNKLDLEQREKSAHERFRAFQEERGRESELALQEEALKIEKEAEREAEELRKKQSSALLELATQQEDDLRSARAAWKREAEVERASFETERRRRVQEYSSELEQLRSDENERMSKLAKAHEAEMEVMLQRREEAISEKKENLDEETANWQRRRLMEIRQDAVGKDKDTYTALREQSEAELDMVIAKLEAQAKEERAGIEEAMEKQLNSLKDNLSVSENRAVEEEQVAMGRYAVDHEKTQILQEEVSLLESRVVGMERRVAITEENLKKETDRAFDVKKEAQLRIDGFKRGQNRGVELAEREIESLKKQLQDLDVTVSDFGSVHGKELERMERRFGNELSSVEDRVKNVLDRKDGVIKELEADFARGKEQSERLSAELDACRKLDLTGGGASPI